MSGSNWDSGTKAVGAAILVLLILAALVASLTYHQTNQSRATAARTPQSTNAERLVDRTLPIASSTEISRPEEREPGEQVSAYAYADLRAQQEMAEWTLAMLFVSIAMFLVTSVGVVYVAQTLSEAKDATRAAVAAAAAADKTAEITREIGESQVRSYISAAFEVVKSDSNKIILKTKIQNSGNSPALNVKMHIAFSVHLFPKVIPGKSIEHPGINPLSTTVNDIASSDSIRYEHSITIPPVGDLGVETGFLIRLLGYIDYNTVFERLSDRYVIEYLGYCNPGFSGVVLNRSPEIFAGKNEFILKALKRMQDRDKSQS